jgi:hypothetical protein
MEGITMEVEVEEVSMAGELIVDQAVGGKNLEAGCCRG